MTYNSPIYHITHVNNLPGIVQCGSLLCDIEAKKHAMVCVGIAYQGLKQRRLETPVPVSACETLGHYVPFYFCNRSPMLCAIHGGKVESYKGSQEEIIYLVSDVESVIEGDIRKWCFSDGHPVERITKFYDAIDYLDQIDWELMQQWSWHDTIDDNDRKRRKQAEFLVHQSFPFSSIKKIGVYSEKQKQVVETILKGYDHKVPIVVERKWYY